MKFEKMCRTCLRTPETLISLLEFENKELLHKIKIISSVEIHSKDELPLWICQECNENVNRSFNFRKVIINSDIELKERYAVLKQLEENSNEENLFNQSNSNEDSSRLDPSRGICEKTNNSVADGQFRKANETKNKKRSFVRLILNRSNGKTYACIKCNYECTNFTQWCIHKKSHVSMKVCNVCGKSMRSDNLNKHIKSHSDVLVECPECHKIFKNAESMRYHLYVHKEEKYQCEICDRSYTYRSGYNRHKKWHIDENSVKGKCELCGKILADKKKVKIHMRTHTNERPYLCEFCGKGFFTNYTRNVHKRLHTNERPFQCKYCSEAFPVKVSLQRHIGSKHKDITEIP